MVIDSNDRVAASVERFQQQILKKAERHRKELLQAYLDRITEDEEGNPVFPVQEDGSLELPYDDDGNLLLPLDENGIPVLPNESGEEPVEPVEELPAADPVLDAEEEAERILSDAREQADSILSDAREQADAIFSHAEAEGQKQGYQEGTARAVSAAEENQRKFEQKKDALAKAYREKESKMEQELVATVTDILEKAFKVQFSDKQEMLLHIVDNAVLNIENSKIFQIRVNESNYNFLMKYKSDIQKKVGDEVQLDFILDPVLDSSACIVETDGGVFDCSLGVQLENLMKDIRILSIDKDS